HDTATTALYTLSSPPLFRSHALGTANLAPETAAYLKLRRRGRDAVAAYPPRARRIHTAYAVTAVALVLLAVAGSVTAVALLVMRSEEHTSELQSRENLVCRL